MKHTPLLAATILAFALSPAHAQADEDATIPLFSATMESYDALSEFVTTVAKATAPDPKEDPLAALELLLAANPDAVNKSRPMHVAVWLNGMFTPLVAVYIPSDDLPALKKLFDTIPNDGNLDFEKLDGYGLILAGAETSLEDNLAGARSMETAAFKADRPMELTVRFDDATRTMIKGILAMGRLQILKESEQLGDEQTVEMMKAILPLYFDAMEGFVDGMETTTLGLDIVDKGMRYTIHSTAKEGTTYAKLISKSPMDPAPIAENYRAEDALGISGRMAKMDDTLIKLFDEIMAMSAKVGGGGDEKTLKDAAGLMAEMTPMYYSFGYDFDEQLTATGIYHFPDSKDVPAIYNKVVKLGQEMGKQMTGDGKIYEDFKHETVTEEGLEIDRFSYTMNTDLPPNPIMGDRMEFEYALNGDRMLFTMGGVNLSKLLEAKDPNPLPDFLQPNDSTVMIGHFDILSLLGTFATLEVSDEFDSPTIFIADNKEKGGKKKDRKNKAKGGGSKILMRADVDGALNFDLHIPLSLLRTLSRMQ